MRETGFETSTEIVAAAATVPSTFTTGTATPAAAASSVLHARTLPVTQPEASPNFGSLQRPTYGGGQSRGSFQKKALPHWNQQSRVPFACRVPFTWNA